MRLDGELTRWDDARGFGRIEAAQGGEPVFVHISAWPRGAARPQPGQRLSFEVETGPRGKRAVRVQPAASPPARGRRAPPRPPAGRGGAGAWGGASVFLVPLFALLYGLLSLWWRPPAWAPLAYLGLSVLTFAVYALDKRAAQQRAWRTAESTLHLLALAGGWPGALLAQQFLRHKSGKASFRQVFWATVLLNLAALVWLASPMGRHWLGAA